MFKQFAIISFDKVKQSELPHIATAIAEKMTENVAIFAAPPVSIKDLKAQISVYTTILDKPDSASRTGDLKNARKILVQSLRVNGIYVNSIANGDLAILEKSGYPISKMHTPVGPLPPPEFLHVKVADGGGFECEAGMVEGYWGYLFAFTEVSNPETDPANWTSHWSSTSWHIIKKGYTRGKEYKFAACAVASSEEIHWVKSGDVIYGS